MNYSVIVNQRNHFGDEQDFLPGVFAGRRKDFRFDCPGVDPGQQSVLMFQALHVNSEKNVFTVNGQTLSWSGPLAVGATSILWPGPPTPANVYAVIAEHRPTLFFSVPTGYGMLLSHEGEFDLSSIRLGVSAGEATRTVTLMRAAGCPRRSCSARGTRRPPSLRSGRPCRRRRRAAGRWLDRR